jgi:hypothetical protein
MRLTRRALAGLTGASISALVICLPPSIVAAARSGHSAVVPTGWKSYTYGIARISVPRNWMVIRTGNCLPRSAPGMLVLGGSTRPSACGAEGSNANIVSLMALPSPDWLLTTCPKIKINHLRVTVGPCTSSNVGGVVLYLIPALGIQAEGIGTAAENVRGPGTGTIVGRVLHTIRRS